MEFVDILNLMHVTTMVRVEMTIFSMKFSTEHPAGYFLDKAKDNNDLLERNIERMYAVENTLVVTLK